MAFCYLNWSSTRNSGGFSYGNLVHSRRSVVGLCADSWTRCRFGFCPCFWMWICYSAFLPVSRHCCRFHPYSFAVLYFSRKMIQSTRWPNSDSHHFCPAFVVSSRPPAEIFCTFEAFSYSASKQPHSLPEDHFHWSATPSSTWLTDTAFQIHYY